MLRPPGAVVFDAQKKSVSPLGDLLLNPTVSPLEGKEAVASQRMEC